MTTILCLDEIREEHDISDYIADEVMYAFAENWFDSADVEWGSLAESFCGAYEADDEDSAIGDYLYELTEDTGELHSVPDWIRYHIDWRSAGRDARFNGELRAERVYGTRDYVVFRNI